RVVETPFFEKTAGEDHRVDHDGERRPWQRKGGSGPNDQPRQRRTQTAVALAGHRDETAPREQAALDDEQAQRKTQQDDRQNRGTTWVLLHADDGKVNRRRQD